MLIFDHVNLILFKFIQSVGLRGWKQASVLNNEIGKAENNDRMSNTRQKHLVHPVMCTRLSYAFK